MARPHIKVLFAGGTIGMVKNPHTGALEPVTNPDAIFRLIPEIQKEMHLEFEWVMNMDSTNMKPENWATLATCIHDQYDKYDGFVIAHGTDTMAYTASALSFALQKLSKPVILTGALIPLSELGSDGRNNLIYACEVATYDLAEVAIVFGSKILRGNRTTKSREALFNVFKSYNYPLLGEIKHPAVLNSWRKKRRKRILEFRPQFNNKVAMITVFPGFEPDCLSRILQAGIEGIVLRGFGPGNIPHNLMPILKREIAKGIPIVVSTQMEHGSTNLRSYEVGYQALKAGVIEAKDMTTEACLTKLMWCLGHTHNMGKIKTMMATDFAGEITMEE
ncbi:MAG: asparaginase [Candidatus Gracilibacteria bacterium]